MCDPEYTKRPACHASYALYSKKILGTGTGIGYFFQWSGEGLHPPLGDKLLGLVIKLFAAVTGL